MALRGQRGPAGSMTWPLQRSTVSPASVQRERAYFSSLQCRAVRGKPVAGAAAGVPVVFVRSTTQRSSAQHSTARRSAAQSQRGLPSVGVVGPQRPGLVILPACRQCNIHFVRPCRRLAAGSPNLWPASAVAGCRFRLGGGGIGSDGPGRHPATPTHPRSAAGCLRPSRRSGCSGTALRCPSSRRASPCPCQSEGQPHSSCGEVWGEAGTGAGTLAAGGACLGL